MLVYLDICCFNRPFDDQTQLFIRLQTEAKLSVQGAIRQGSLTLAWSAMMDLENAANPDSDRREAIALWKKLSSVDVEVGPEIEARGRGPRLAGRKAHGRVARRERHGGGRKLAPDDGCCAY